MNRANYMYMQLFVKEHFLSYRSVDTGSDPPKT